jgi:ABC-type uncharacterized transport system ATPase subunit
MSRSGDLKPHRIKSIMDYAIQMTGITKHFPRVVANDEVDLNVGKGEIHALVGENGAGKTTLMNILYGLLKPDRGEILVGGRRLPTEHGFLGLDFGIGMIHQHFMLIGNFTVLENIILGAEPKRGMMLDLKAARDRIEGLMAEYGIKVDLDRRIDDLSVGEEQRVEILKVLYRDADIIIMDEPTAVLTPQETQSLFKTLRILTEGGRTIIFITHKLEEVMEIADTVTVMRKGAAVATMPKAQSDTSTLAEMMVGRKLEVLTGRVEPKLGEIVLDVRRVSLVSPKGQVFLDRVSLSVRRGEIFGICGVDGNGQDELFEVLIGLTQPSTGAVEFLGQDLTHEPTARRLKAGLAHIPADRIRMGLIGSFSLSENLILGRHREREFSGRTFLKGRAITESAVRRIAEFGIEPPVPEMRAELLSGGNQQKVVVARELSGNPDLLIASQPTRGLDIGAARLIHELLLKQADSGRSVLLISADLAEVMSLADTIGVMYRGSIVGTMARQDANEERLGLMMAGVGS